MTIDDNGIRFCLMLEKKETDRFVANGEVDYFL